MRGRDDRAAADQRAIHALRLARLRALLECQGRLTPQCPSEDRIFADEELFSVPDSWESLCVDYLRAEWPPARLN